MKKKLQLIFLILASISLVVTSISDTRKEQLKCMENMQILGSDNKCHTPTYPGPCEEDHFIVLDKTKDLFQGYCKLKCTKPDFVRKDGKCKPAFWKKYCRGIGERLFNNIYGEASKCECEDGWDRHTDGDCYQENTHGWCQDGMVLRIEDDPSSLQKLNITNEGMELTEDEMTIKTFIRQLKSFYREKLVCAKNPCQDGYLWWEDPETGESDCFEIVEELSDWQTGGPCVVILNKDPDFDFNKIICEPNFEAFTLVPDMAKPCKKGKTWSKHRSKCVRDFSG